MRTAVKSNHCCRGFIVASHRENTLLCLHKTPILFHFDDCQCFNSFGFLKVKRGESAKTPKRPPKHVGKKKAPHSFLSLGV